LRRKYNLARRTRAARPISIFSMEPGRPSRALDISLHWT
jgi:hypothetical protein